MALLIIAAPMATALTAEEAEHFLQGVYNPNVDNIIPDLPLVKNVFAGQVIHIIITKQNGNIEFDATTDPNGYITHLEREAPEEPTLRLKSDEETIETIINSDNPIKETQEALLNGKITYEGVTIGNKIQVAIINLVQWAAQLFGAV
ncbi:hypothetical protein B6U67_02170 [Methanosarcinales archaeon ex4484_138]|nr:MAG: hypothetical protein B6U67_02170 [Methanosarcinales archaeon ex4484_138]RLG26149.1 MAG: hypothetical protein DRN85_03835 [Methanosarcinales archaeon]RLG27690.1 MAG: hypothetical protein DRN70_01780 [Methanosarcinales archaeon]